MRRMFCKNQRSRAIECLLTESHIHGNMYVWFGGRHGETSHRNMVWRPVSSLQAINPLAMDAPPSLPVKPELRDSFLLIKESYQVELDSLHRQYTDTILEIKQTPDSIQINQPSNKESK